MKLNKILKLQNELAKYNYKCKKNCFECCTAIFFLSEELKLMNKELLKNGYKAPPNGKGKKYCEYLTSEGKCSIYKARPVICKSFSDLKFLFKGPVKNIAMQSCTYGEQNRVVEVWKDYYDYGEELLDKGLMNENAKYIIASLGNKNPLIGKENTIKNDLLKRSLNGLKNKEQ